MFGRPNKVRAFCFAFPFPQSRLTRTGLNWHGRTRVVADVRLGEGRAMSKLSEWVVRRTSARMPNVTSVRIAILVCLSLTAPCCTVHIDDWPREFGSALCRHQQRCGQLPVSVDCNNPEFWPAEPIELAASRAGLLVYNRSAATSCIELLERMSCIGDPYDRAMRTAECHATFQATLAANQRCSPIWPRGCEFGCGIPLDLATRQTQDTCGQCIRVAQEGEAASLTLGVRG